jgi:hypothetical protein
LQNYENFFKKEKKVLSRVAFFEAFSIIANSFFPSDTTAFDCCFPAGEDNYHS